MPKNKDMDEAAVLVLHTLYETIKGKKIGQRMGRGISARIEVALRIPLVLMDVSPGPVLAPVYIRNPYEDPRVEEEAIKSLFVAILRRSVSDWVLYKDAVDPELVEYAREADLWLFREEPGHVLYDTRAKDGFNLFSFLSVCDLLDLDAGHVRKCIKQLTKSQIANYGKGEAAEKSAAIFEAGLPTSVSSFLDSYSVDD